MVRYTQPTVYSPWSRQMLNQELTLWQLTLSFPVMLFVQLIRIKGTLLITYFMSFYWTHFLSARPNKGLFINDLLVANVKNFGICFFPQAKKPKCHVCVKLCNIPQRSVRQRWTGMNAPFATQRKEPEPHMCYQQTHTAAMGSRPRREIDFSEGIK